MKLIPIINLCTLAAVKVGDTIRVGKKKYKVMQLYRYYALCDTGLYRECLSYIDIITIRSGKFVVNGNIVSAEVRGRKSKYEQA